MASHTPDQIAAALNDAHQLDVQSVCEKYRIDEATLTRWRRRYGNQGAQEIQAMQRNSLLLRCGAAALLVLVLATAAWQWLPGWIAPKGDLLVETKLPEANVYLDGTYRGDTPLHIAQLPHGTYALRLNHAYRLEHQQSVTIDGDMQRLSIELGARFGNLQVLSNPKGANITLDGHQTGFTTPHRFDDLLAGAHEIELRLEGRRVHRGTGTVEPSRTSDYVGDLNIIPSGRLTVNVVPTNARLSIEGMDIPYKPGVTLPVGEYNVTASANGYETQTLRLAVYYDQHARGNLKLPRIDSRLIVRAEPDDAQIHIRSGTDYVPYRSGMKLPSQRKISVRVRKTGYRTQFRELTLGTRGATVNVALSRISYTLGEKIRDALKSGGYAPTVITLAPGQFTMGSGPDTGYGDERPAHTVNLTQPFAIGETEVTNAQYNRYLVASGKDTRDLEGNLPVTDVTYGEAQNYVRWLSKETGRSYRLPSEAEWEYAGRAGTTTTYHFGDDPLALCKYANVADRAAKKVFRGWQVVDCNDGFARTAPVASFAPNAWGLFDIHGNVNEWTDDCWNQGYEGAPDDGAAWHGDNCQVHIPRGGSWDSGEDETRIAYRFSTWEAANDRGIRVARDL